MPTSGKAEFLNHKGHEEKTGFQRIVARHEYLIGKSIALPCVTTNPRNSLSLSLRTFVSFVVKGYLNHRESWLLQTVLS
jgi:hypothetical protein